MRGFIRVACCAVLIGTLVPAGAFAAPSTDAREGHKARIAAEKTRAITPAGAVFAELAADAYELDDEWPGQVVGGLPLEQDHTLLLTPESVQDEDIDSYTLNTVPGTQYSFSTSGTLDTVITLYNPETYEILGWNDDQVDGNLAANLVWTATADVPQVVCEVSGWAKDGSYRMQINATPDSVRPAMLGRISGNNRIAGAVATAKAIYGTGYDKFDGSPVTDVIVVCGEDKSIVDSLSAASLAGWWQAPLLMTYSSKLPSETSKAISAIRAGNGGKVKIHVLGGTSVVPAGIYSQLSKLKGSGGSIERISANNRYALSEKVAMRLASLMKADPDVAAYPYEVFVANGENPAAFFDALAASGYCYSLNAPLLLTRNATVPAETKRALTSPAFVDAWVNPVNGSKYMPASVLKGIYATDADRLTTSSDRYLAALDIAQWGFYTYSATQDQVVVVNKMADALAAGTYIGATGGVMLYAPISGPSGATALFLSDRKSAISYADVFGGEVCISAAGYNKVGTLLNSK